MKKSIIALSLSTSLLLVGLSSMNVAASTSQMPSQNNLKQVSNKAEGVVDVNSELSKINKYYFDDHMSWKVFDSYRAIRMEGQSTSIPNFNLETDKVHNITVKDMAPEYIGENVFTNSTDNEQTYNTITYAHTQTKTVSTAVTKGFSVGGKTTVVKIPIVLPNGIDVNATLNSSTTNTTTNTESKTITVPAQAVNVPAHKKYKAVVTYNRKSLSGNINFKGTGTNLTSNITALMSWTGGMNRPNKQRTFNFDTGKLWDSLSTSQKNNIQGLKFNNNSFNIEGTSTIEGIVGTNFEVNTYDITNEKAPILVKTAQVN